MRWLIFLVLVGIALCAPSKDPAEGKVRGKAANKPAVVNIFGTQVTLPVWMDKAKIALRGFYGKLARFFSGDISFSTSILGTTIQFRTNIPDSKEEASKSVLRFFSNLKADSATRVIFVIYVNLVALFVIYSLLFIKQIQLHRQQKREERMTKKQQKLDEEERQWLALTRPNPGDEDMPLVSRYPSLTPLSPQEMEEKRGSFYETALEHSVIDAPDDHVRPVPRLLLPEIFSPIEIEEAEDAQNSLLHNSPQFNMGQAPKFNGEVFVHRGADDE